MPKVYDDWVRLVRATVRREELWQLCHEHSRTPSDGSTSTTSGSSSPILNVSVSPKSLRSRVSPLGSSVEEVVQLSDSTIVLPVDQQAVNGEEEIASESRGKGRAEAETLSEGGSRFKKDKSMERRSKSRLRLDRWVWTRWLSKTL